MCWLVQLQKLSGSAEQVLNHSISSSSRARVAQSAGTSWISLGQDPKCQESILDQLRGHEFRVDEASKPQSPVLEADFRLQLVLHHIWAARGCHSDHSEVQVHMSVSTRSRDQENSHEPEPASRGLDESAI